MPKLSILTAIQSHLQTIDPMACSRDPHLGVAEGEDGSDAGAVEVTRDLTVETAIEETVMEMVLIRDIFRPVLLRIPGRVRKNGIWAVTVIGEDGNSQGRMSNQI